jgi:hypothetical protein
MFASGKCLAFIWLFGQQDLLLQFAEIRGLQHCRSRSGEKVKSEIGAV